jgi:hypothetical protein
VAFVAPVEHDHQGEGDASGTYKQIEAEARKDIPHLTSLRADVTFGPNSTFCHQILQRIYGGRNIYCKPMGGSPAPVFSGDLETIISKIMSDASHQGKSFVATGQKRTDFNSMINVLANACGHSQSAKINSC